MSNDLHKICRKQYGFRIDDWCSTGDSAVVVGS